MHVLRHLPTYINAKIHTLTYAYMHAQTDSYVSCIDTLM